MIIYGHIIYKLNWKWSIYLNAKIKIINLIEAKDKERGKGKSRGHKKKEKVGTIKKKYIDKLGFLKNLYICFSKEKLKKMKWQEHITTQ